MISRLTLPFALALGLSACGGGDSSGGGSGDTPPPRTITISSASAVTDVNEPDAVNLLISGASSNTTVHSNLAALNIGAASALVTFASIVSVDSCLITGSDVTVIKPSGMNLTCSISGSSSRVIDQ